MCRDEEDFARLDRYVEMVLADKIGSSMRFFLKKYKNVVEGRQVRCISAMSVARFGVFHSQDSIFNAFSLLSPSLSAGGLLYEKEDLH